jgi:multiple sugar transport system substrate-binding protein
MMAKSSIGRTGCLGASGIGSRTEGETTGRTAVTRRAAMGGATAGALGPLLAACGAGERTGAEPAQGRALRSGITLTWMSGLDGQPNQDARNEQIARFRERQPGIQVERQRVEDYGAKLIAAFAAGTPPDLYTTGRANVTSQATRGYSLALDDLVKRDKFSLTDFYPTSYEQYRINGKLYALSYDFPNRCLFANMSAFDEAGIRRPPSTYKDESWTWDAFRVAMEGLQRRVGPQGSWAFDANRGLRSWMPWVWNNGGDLLSKDGREVVLHEPAGVEALAFLQDMITRYQVSPPQAGRQAPLRVFTQGKLVVYENAQTAIGQMRQDIGQSFSWDTVPLPKGKGARAASGGGSGYSMSATGQNKEETWAFFKHVMSRESHNTWMTVVGAMVPFKTLVESPAFLAPPPAHMSLFVEGATLLRLDPTAARWNEVDQVLNEELNKLWAGTQAPKQVADSIKRLVDPLLKD